MDVALPDHVGALYVGGGYPELHAERLAQNTCGHEFHYSVLDGASDSPAYRYVGGNATEGIVAGPCDNVLASYLHVHFGTDPRLAERFVACAAGEPLHRKAVIPD